MLYGKKNVRSDLIQGLNASPLLKKSEPTSVKAEPPMIVVDPVPVKIRVDDVLHTLKIGTQKQQEAKSTIEKGLGMISPRAVYTFAKVKSIKETRVLLDSGQYVQSIILSDTLELGQTVALFVATIGENLEREASRQGKTSILNAWVLEQTGDYALRKASAYVKARAEETLGGNVSCFSPGTGTGKLFSIDQQRTLFEVLDPQKNVGVTLSPSFLMVPRKSVSGILAATRQEYDACQYCPRERCMNRRKPFSGEYFPLSCEH
jgi:hypothetical protein